MKKICTFLLFTVSLVGFAQGITVYPTSGNAATPDGTKLYSVNDLVNKVLLDAPCAATLNVIQKNGNMFGSSNSIGYFENMDIDNSNLLNNTHFPYLKGVVLTSGDVSKTRGPKGASPLSDGSASWTGDTDLNTAIENAGITTSLNSINASSLEFDFTAVVSNLNFKFLFASEEYGPGQCAFADSFAFLIKDLSVPGATYQNIAVIPNTTIPISVGTIRNQSFNNGCPSVNPQFFGGINNVGYGPAINFNGQTISMAANAPLILTHQYHMKIVVADSKNNVDYDSAIFLEAGSFNIIANPPLPSDMVALNGICPGDLLPTVCATGLAPNTTYNWYLNGSNIYNTSTTQTCVNLNDFNPVNINPGDINILNLQYKEPGCITRTDSFLFEIFNKIGSLTVVPDIYVCSTGAASYPFDLTKNTVKIIDNNPNNPNDSLPADTSISYYLTNAQAITGLPINQLASPYVGTDNQTIWVRVSNPTTGCYEIRSFKLKVIPVPAVVAVPTPVTQCARNATDVVPQSLFNLANQMAIILGGPTPTYYDVTYYVSQTTANNATPSGVLTTASMYTSPTRTIWVRIQNSSDPSCFVVTSFDVIVTPLPPVDTIANVKTCSSYSLPALTTLPTATTTGAGYYAATGGVTPIGLPTTYSTPGEINIFIFNQTIGTPVCKSEKPLKIIIADIASTSPTSISPPSATYCQNDHYNLPSLPYGNYYDNAQGTGTPMSGEITTTQNLFVVFSDPLASPAACTINNPFTITIIPFVELDSNDYPNKFSCNPGFVLPLSTVPGVVYYKDAAHSQPFTLANNTINVTTVVYVQKKSTTTPPCSSELSFTVFIGIGNIVVPTDVTECTSYTLPTLTVGEYRTAAGAGGIGGGTIISPSTIINTTTVIYYHISGQACTDPIFFTVTILTTPLPTFNNIIACDHTELLAVTHAGDYRTAANGAGAIRPVGYSVTSTQPMNFYYDSGQFTSSGIACKLNASFNITINYTPSLPPVLPQVAPLCNSSATPCYLVPTLSNGHYYALAGGSSTPGNQLIDNTTICAPGVTTIYAYDSNNLPSPNTCVNEIASVITIFQGQVTPIADVYACNSFALPPISGVGDYYTMSGGPSTIGNVKINLSTYPPVTTTKDFWVYYYNPDPRADNCSSEDKFTVNILITPVVNSHLPIPAVTKCDTYTLPAYSAISITANPSVVSVHYYPNPGGPTVAGNIAGEKFPGDVITASTTLYAYASVQGTVGTTTTVCSDEQPWQITINYTPVFVPSEIVPVAKCDTYTLPALTVGKYYTDATHSTLLTNLTITNTATAYVYAETITSPNCVISNTFLVTINHTPVITSIPSETRCSSYDLPTYAAPVTAYYTFSGGPLTSPNPTKAPGDLITTTTTLYAYADTGTTPNCPVELAFNVIIDYPPVVAPIAPVFSCDTYILPALIAPATKYYTTNNPATRVELYAGNVINSSTTIYAYAESGTIPCATYEPMVITITTTPVINPNDFAPINRCNSYTLPALATAGANYYLGSNGTGIISSNTVVSSNKSIYVYAVNGTAPNTCSSEQSLSIVIFNVDDPYPLSTYPTGVQSCGPFLLPVLATTGAQYYNGPNGSGGTILPNIGGQTYVYNTQPVYIYGTSPFSPSCTDEVMFIVNVNANPIANPVPAALTTVCDLDGIDDHITSFDVTTLTPTILGTQSPLTYIVEYFPTLLDAQARTNPILTTTTLGTIYARVSNSITISCNAIVAITISVVPLPKIDLGLKGTICIDSTTGQITPPVISSGYSSALYSFLWTDSSTPPVGVGTSPDFLPTIPGSYSLVITASGVSGCASAPIPVTVIQSAKPSSITFTTSGWFTNNQTIIVNAVPYPGTGNGTNFVYSLDGQTPQTSNIFTNVDSTSHEVTVIDINGCGDLPLPVPVPLVNSPAYFSPNGDGINDIWRIKGLENQLDSEVFIYDRYGKLIKQITVNSDGWDGTANGFSLPADDYWFTVTYVENGEPKEYKSHFTLRR